MKINFQRLSTSRFGIAIALGIGRFIPPSVGYRLMDIIARRISSSKDDSMIQALRANQWVAANGSLSSEQLDNIVYDTFHHHTRCLYTYFRGLSNPSAMDNLVEMTPDFERLVENSKGREKPSVIGGLHMSNFDLAAYILSMQGLHALALALDNPESGHQWQYRIRRKYGFEVVPASMATLRQAERRLLEGKTVLTGIDRPIPESKYPLMFFNRPAYLPVMHVHLALRTKVPVVVAATIMGDDGIYRICASDPIPMVHYPDRKTAMIKNAENVLRVAEDFIRKWPRQWVMFLPVWPEALKEVP